MELVGLAGLLAVVLSDGVADGTMTALAEPVGAEDELAGAGTGGGAAVVGAGRTGTAVVCTGTGTDEICELCETCERCELWEPAPETCDE